MGVGERRTRAKERASEGESPPQKKRCGGEVEAKAVAVVVALLLLLVGDLVVFLSRGGAYE